jgi:hypothetical protein
VDWIDTPHKVEFQKMAIELQTKVLLITQTEDFSKFLLKKPKNSILMFNIISLGTRMQEVIVEEVKELDLFLFLM